jgi:hypothetical protein
MTFVNTQIFDLSDLYQQDYLLWVDRTVAELAAKNFNQLDLENLIEEVKDLGRSQKRELKQRLATLLEHLLKRLYVNLPEEFSGWERTIREQRRQIKFELEDSPSLKAIWAESLASAWRFALETVRDDYAQFQFPDRWTYGSEIESILNQTFWQ